MRTTWGFAAGLLILSACGGGEGPGEPAPPPPPPASPTVVPASLTVQAGDNQEAAPGSGVPAAPVFLVKDGQGRPYAGAAVAFGVASGGGSVERATGTSAVDGTVSPGKWTLGPAEGTNQLRATLGTLPPVTITAHGRHPVITLVDQTVGPAGGTLTYTKPGDPLNGLRLTIPSGAYVTGGRWVISTSVRTAGPSNEGFVAGGIAVRVSTDQRRSAKLLTLRLPLRAAKDSIPTVFFYDRAAEYLEPVPVTRFDATSVTIVSTHFSSRELGAPASGPLAAAPPDPKDDPPFFDEDAGVVLSTTYATTQILTLNPRGVSSPFQPASNGWEFPNHGSYITPGGQPNGQSLSALWYYLFVSNSPSDGLFGRFDRIGGAHWMDNPGYRLAAVAEQDANWAAVAPVLQSMNANIQYGSLSRDQGMLFLLANAILVGKRPQLIAATGPGAGVVALVVIRASLTELEVLDPNNPGASFSIGFQGGAFQPFQLPSIVGGPSATYNQITTIGHTALIPGFSQRFAPLLNGQSVGDDKFPAYTIQYRDEDLGVWTNVPGDKVQVPWKDVLLRVLCPSCATQLPVGPTVVPGQTAFDVYDQLGNPLGSDRGTGFVSFRVPAGTSRVGVHVLGRCGACGTAWMHIDYKLLTTDVSQITISPDPIVLQPNVAGTLTAQNAGSTPANVRYQWTFGDGKTAQADNNNKVTHAWTGAGSFDVNVTVTDLSNLRVIGRAASKALVGLAVPVWRLTQFKLKTSSFDNLPKETWSLDAYSPDDEIFRTLQARPDFGLITWQPGATVVAGQAYAQGSYLVYDPTRVAGGIGPQWKVRTLARALQTPPTAGDVTDRLTMDGLTASGSVTSGSFSGQAVNFWIPHSGGHTITYWSIDAAKSGATLTGTIVRIQRLWEQNCVIVPRPNPKPGEPTGDLVCPPAGTPLSDLGTIRHEWTFTATRLQ